MFMPLAYREWKRSSVGWLVAEEGVLHGLINRLIHRLAFGLALRFLSL